MTAKEYLSQCYRLEKKNQSDIEEIKKLEALKTRLSSGNHNEGSSGSRPHDAKYVSIICKIDAYEKYIQKNIDRFVSLKRKIRKEIERLEDCNEQAVLINRYLNFMEWEQIAEVMCYSRRQVVRFYNSALVSFYKKNKDIVKCC